MLICGEDLGMIPQSVPEVMNELHILSLELERTPKSSGADYTDLQAVPYLSVCTTSTHDMEPLREWWKEDIQRRQHYYEKVLHRTGKAPHNCTSELAGQIIMNHLQSSSMLTIIPLQDWWTLDDTMYRRNMASERINIPDNPHHYWNYRMRISLEQLLQSGDLNQKIRKMIAESGR
jgi:4-alpha-glucanotransferase